MYTECRANGYDSNIFFYTLISKSSTYTYTAGYNECVKYLLYTAIPRKDRIFISQVVVNNRYCYYCCYLQLRNTRPL